jgi:SAM-dependent methyltransferase
MWNQRYSAEHYVYGTEPNDFLAASLEQLPTGRVLCLAEGEGRNAVFLAALGNQVTAVDASSVGLAKARRLAAKHGVEIETLTSDLAELEIEPGAWDLIVSIFAHTPAPLRADLHRRVATGLRPGGVFLLEAYTPDQLRYATGGPPTAELMMTLNALRGELAGLELLHAVERVRPVHEGELHFGDGAVVQVIARRPAGG